MPREPKLQRWTDLIAALLRRNFKDEVRAFGIPIETIPSKEEGEAAGYKLDKKAFNLPYLSLAG